MNAVQSQEMKQTAVMAAATFEALTELLKVTSIELSSRLTQHLRFVGRTIELMGKAVETNNTNEFLQMVAMYHSMMEQLTEELETEMMSLVAMHRVNHSTPKEERN